MGRTTSDAEALIGMLRYAPWNVEAGREVLRTLEGLGGRAVGALARTLADPERARFLRLSSAWVLGRIATPEARAVLRAGLSDPDPDVARASAKALDPHPHLPPQVA
jgi:hypothetical protein